MRIEYVQLPEVNFRKEKESSRSIEGIETGVIFRDTVTDLGQSESKADDPMILEIEIVVSARASRGKDPRSSMIGGARVK